MAEYPVTIGVDIEMQLRNPNPMPYVTLNHLVT